MDERDDADRDGGERRPDPNRQTDPTPGTATPADRPTDANAPEATARRNPGGDGGATETAAGGSDARTEDDEPTAGTGDGEGTDAVGGSGAVDGDARASDEQLLGPLEPGQPELENALFVALGALGTVALFASVF